MRNQALYLLIAITIAGHGAAITIVTARNQQPVGYYAYVLRPKNPDYITKGPSPEDLPVLQAHVKYLQGLIEKGTCVVAGHTLSHDETGFGIVIIKTDSAITAEGFMERDPLVQAGILKGSVYPFDVTIAPNAASH